MNEKPKPARKRTDNGVMFFYESNGISAKRVANRPPLVRFVVVANSREADKYAWAAFDLIDAKGVRRRFVATPSGIKEKTDGKA